MDETGAAGGAFATAALIIGAVLALLVVVLIIAALISILIHKNLTAGGKLLWVLGVLYLPVLGSVAWFVVGKKGYLNRLVGVDKGYRREAVSPGQHSDQRHGPHGLGGAPA
ncbi:PLD nuclease N-terminal domain-containing protein [Nocardiopsis ansamitocini]|nr:PLD nuclease N-terminal domain-containing protein [Nocardiopsis ansamitocini]